MIGMLQLCTHAISKQALKVNARAEPPGKTALTGAAAGAEACRLSHIQAQKESKNFTRNIHRMQGAGMAARRKGHMQRKQDIQVAHAGPHTVVQAHGMPMRGTPQRWAWPAQHPSVSGVCWGQGRSGVAARLPGLPLSGPHSHTYCTICGRREPLPCMSECVLRPACLPALTNSHANPATIVHQATATLSSACSQCGAPCYFGGTRTGGAAAAVREGGEGRRAPARAAKPWPVGARVSGRMARAAAHRLGKGLDRLV